MKRTILQTLAALIAVIAILVILPSFINWSKYKPLIIGRIQDATGYHVEIAGNLDMRLLPSPRLIVANLTVTPPNAAIPLLTLDRADVTIALLPLLGRHIVVDSVALMKPQVNLTIAADGTPSWLTPKLRNSMNGASPSPSGGQKSQLSNAVALRQIYVKDASLLYTDNRAGKSYAVGDIDMSIQGDTLLGPYNAQGTATYKRKPVKLTFKTGKIESGADSVSAQADIGIPGLVTVSYAGVIGLQGGHDLQGMTTIEAKSLKGLLDFVTGGAAPASLDKPFRAQAMLSFGAADTGLKNLKFALGETGFSGSLVVKNSAAKAPLDATVTLVADKAFDLTPWLPAAAQAKPVAVLDKKAAGKPVVVPAAAVFLPDSLTLPMPMTLNLNVSAPSLQYKTMHFAGFNLTGTYADRKAIGTLKAGLPEGSFAGGFALTYGSASRAASGALVLADPSLTYQIELKSSDAAHALAPFMPAEQAKTLLPLLNGPLTLTAAGGVTGRTVNVDTANLGLLGSAIAFKGAYAPAAAGGRDALTVTASADKIDVDQWQVRLAPPAESGTAAPSPVATATAVKQPVPSPIREAARRLILPFDLDMSLTADTVHWKNSDYHKFNLIAALREDALNLKTLQVDDPAGNSILAAGTVGDLATLKDLDLSVQGKTQDLKTVLVGFDPKFKTLPDTLKDAELVAEVKGQADAVSFTANLKAMGGTFDSTGALANMLDKPTLTSLTVRARHPSFVDVARLFNPDFSASVAIKKSLDLFGTLKRNGNIYTLSDLQGEIGPATFSGDITADVSGVRPNVKAKLEMSDVPLGDLIGHGGAAHGAAPGLGADSAAAVEKGGQGHWSRDVMNTDWLHKCDVDLSASIKSMSYGTWKLDNGVLQAALKDGTLTLTKLTGAMYGGQVSLTGKMASALDKATGKAQGPLTITGKADLQSVALEDFANSFAASHVVTAHGTVSLLADIQTTGDSPANLIGALGGKGTASGKNITFEGFDLARFSRTLVAPSSSVKNNLSEVLGSTMQGGTTSFDTLSSAFTIDKGIVTISDLTLKGAAATVSSPGTIDLPLWRIDMESTIQLADPKDAPPLKVAIKGPLDQPAKAFGKSALDAYFGTKLQGLLSKALEKKGLGANAATPLTDQAPTASSTTPATATPTPASADTPSVKPKDVFKNMLQGVLQGQ